MSILIVDDTPDNIFLIKEILGKKGYSGLITAESAQEAFRKLGLDTLPPRLTDVDLVLMDIMMPEMNGIDACRIVKSSATTHDIPIIMITAKTDLESVEHAFNAGAMDYILKPFKKMDLLARVQSALSLKGAMDERKKHEHELEIRNKELERAFQEIKVLRGFLPICAHCKKIRNVEGYWQQMESYLQEHSEVRFSHGICKECMRTQYPDYIRKEKAA